MSFWKNLLSTVVTGSNYFKRDEYGNVSNDHDSIQTLRLQGGLDCKGRPDEIWQASSYREVPNLGTWDGTQVHTKIAPYTWHVHYEDYDTEGLE